LEALKAREAEVAKVTGLLIFPPVGRLRKHRIARLKAAEAMAAGVKYVEQLGGFSGEKIKRILGEARDIDQRIALSVLRLGRMVEVLGVLWAIVVTTGGLMFQQHLAVQERERQRLTSEANAAEEKVLAEAKVEVTAEERERQQLALEVKAAEEKALSEAKAKVEAAETVFASKLGLSKPFVAGDRGQAGDLAVRWIPSGRFTMGSPLSEPGRDSDEVQHEVVLTRGFFLAETECTQAQWVAIMESNKSIFKLSDRPVECVSWEEAIEYCWKLTLKQRSDGLLPVGWEWRLPTESEWEYAARGGKTGPRHGQLDTIAWYYGNSGGQTHPVKQKAANAWGLHDMMGNVWEWCSDWRGDDLTESVIDPKGPSSGSFRMIRGGSWYVDANSTRSAFRDGRDSGERYASLGFRPALSSVR
jgi:formylglycine-generating enzyme required for sulfatase activity